MQEIIGDIRQAQRERFFMMRQRMATHARLGAYVRIAIGWSPQLPEAERAKIAKEAARLIKNGDPRFDHLIEGTRAAVEPFKKMEHESELKAARLARKLPVWKGWGEGICGFGDNGLAVIIGEAGNLSGYEAFCQLKKRMGIAVIDGIAQGKLPKSAPAEQWTEHGYNRVRRSRLHAYVTIPMIMQKEKCPYYAYYLRHKEAEADRCKNAKHADLRARRKMEKVFLKHLWQNWRRLDSVPA